MDSASGVVRPCQGGVGGGIQNHIGPITIGCLEGSIDERIHGLLQLQQPLLIIVDLLQRDTLLNQCSFNLTAQLLGEIQALGGQTIQVIDQVILCVFQVKLHHFLNPLIALGKDSGNGQKEDYRRKDHQDHGYPVEHQLSLHTYALLFGKGVQRPQLPEFVPHGVSSSLLVIAP